MAKRNRTSRVATWGKQSGSTFPIDTRVPKPPKPSSLSRYVPAEGRLRRLALGFEHDNVPGMRIQLTAIRGLTRPGVLKAPYRFQVPPDTFTRTLGYTHNDFDTLTAGQHSRPASLQEEQVAFTTMLVEFDPNWAVWPNSHAAEILDDSDRDALWNVLNLQEELENLLSSGTPCLLRCGQPSYWDGGDRSADRDGDKKRQGGWDVNMPATMRGLTIEERAGEPDARYLNCTFSEYRRLDLTREGRGRLSGKKSKSTSRGKEDLTPCTVEVFVDSSGVDRTNEDHKLFDQEGRTRLVLAVSASPKLPTTLSVQDTSTFTQLGVLICRSNSIQYGSIDSKTFRDVALLGPPSTATFPAGSVITQNPGKGATLRGLAKLYYGRPNMWTTIRAANAVLVRLAVTGDQLLGDVCEALGVTSIKITVPRPPKSPSVGQLPRGSGGAGIGA